MTTRRKNILPGLQVPAGLPVELEKFLMAVKEALQGGQGTKGQPTERFVTLEDLERVGLINTAVRNGRGEIRSLNVEGIGLGLGVDFSSSAASSIESFGDLDDVLTAGAIEGDGIRWRAGIGKWQRTPLFDSTGIIVDAVIPDSIVRFDDTFTDTVNGLVPAPITPADLFLRDDGTWQIVSTSGGDGGSALVYANLDVVGNTVSNTVTETAVTSKWTIAANTLADGQVVRVWLAGTATNTSGAPTTVKFRLKINGVSMLVSAAIVIADSLTNVGWTAEAAIVMQTDGASAITESQGDIRFNILPQPWANSAAGTIDTTIAQDMTATIEFGNANAAITATVREFVVWVDGIPATPPALSDSTYIVADDESLSTLTNALLLVEGLNIEFDYTVDNELTINNTMVDISGYQLWTADNNADVMAESQMVVEGQNVELDYATDNEVKIDVYPVFVKGGSWSTTDIATAIDQAKAPEITIPISVNCWIQEVVVTTTGGSGSCVIDVEKSDLAGFPTTNSITASAKPTVTASTKYSDSTLVGWTRTITAGDILRFQLESSSNFKSITIILKLKETP